MSALCVVQARMSSTRLPGKTLADVAGEPLLALLLRRLARARELSRIVVATTTDPEDEPIAVLARRLGHDQYRGPRDDVLTRVADAAGGYPGPIVRITGDCPLIDPDVVDGVVRLLAEAGDRAYASNVSPRTYPDGLDVEAMTPEALAEAAAEARDRSDREHVTTAIRRDPERFPAATLEGSDELAGLRWTVDTEEDLEFVRRVVERLGDRRYEAGVEEILAAIRMEPSLAAYEGRRG